jgi:hypothetical protein
VFAAATRNAVPSYPYRPATITRRSAHRIATAASTNGSALSARSRIQRGRRQLCSARQCRLDYRNFRPSYVLESALGLPPAPKCKSDSRSPCGTGTKIGIKGPAAVIQAEIIDSREWTEVVSSDGVKSYVSQLRKRALVDGEAA